MKRHKGYRHQSRGDSKTIYMKAGIDPVHQRYVPLKRINADYPQFRIDWKLQGKTSRNLPTLPTKFSLVRLFTGKTKYALRMHPHAAEITTYSSK